MGSRLDLQTLLEKNLESRNVYFQPPSTIKLNYPAIVYSRDSIESLFSEDRVYCQYYSYQITVITINPDDEIVSKISKLSKCKHLRNFKSDNLNHDIFKLYF